MVRDAVIVAGGGIIGLACAFECRLRGFDVTVVEKGRCGGQASGAAAGMLAPFSENPDQPDAFFELCRDSLTMYEEWLAKVRDYSAIDAEFVRSGSLNVVTCEADIQPMIRRMRWQRKAGARAEWLEPHDLRRLEPALAEEVMGALYYPDEAHVYAPIYVETLEEACRKAGVTVIEGCGAVELREWQEGIVLKGDGFETLYGERLVIATGAWSAEWQHLFDVHWPVYPIRGQICAYPSVFGEIRHIVYSSQGYVVGKRNDTLVCGASEDVAGFDTSVTERGIGRLIRWSGRLIPALKGREICLKWAGLRPATQDGFPVLGPVKPAPRVICAFGHYRNGILLSPATAKLVGDWAEGRETVPYAEAFDPMRFTYDY